MLDSRLQLIASELHAAELARAAACTVRRPDEVEAPCSRRPVRGRPRRALAVRGRRVVSLAPWAITRGQS